MNKSKFLKKSLAMLLALMLVVAMIPLSASAAEGPKVTEVTVDGVAASGSDTSYSATIVEPTDAVKVTVEIESAAGTVAHYTDGTLLNSNNAKLEGEVYAFTLTEEEMIAEEFTFDVLQGGKVVETYTVSYDTVPASADTSLKTVYLDGQYDCWNNIDSNKETDYTVVAPYGLTLNDTTYVEVTPNNEGASVYVGDTKLNRDADGTFHVTVSAYNKRTLFSVRAANEAQENYTVTVVKPIPFASFSMEDQRHEAQISRVTEEPNFQVDKVNKDATVELYMPYKYDGDFTPTFETNYGVTVSVNKTGVELKSGETYDWEEDLGVTDITKDFTVPVTVKYSDDKKEPWTLAFDVRNTGAGERDTIPAIKGLTVNNYVAEIEGTTITLTIPQSVRKNATTLAIDMSEGTQADIVNTKTAPKTADADETTADTWWVGEGFLAAKDQYRIRVTAAIDEFDAEGAKAVQDYTLNIVTAEVQDPELNRLTLKSEKTGETLEGRIVGAKVYFDGENAIPYRYKGLADMNADKWQLFWSATSGTTVTVAENAQPTDNVLPITGSYVPATWCGYLPFGGNRYSNTEADRYIVVANDTSVQAYKVVFTSAPASQNSTLGDVTLAMNDVEKYEDLNTQNQTEAIVNNTENTISAEIWYKDWWNYTSYNSDTDKVGGATVVTTLPAEAKLFTVDGNGQKLREIQVLNEDTLKVDDDDRLPTVKFDGTYWAYGQRYNEGAATPLKLIVVSEALAEKFNTGSSYSALATEPNKPFYTEYELTLTQKAPRTGNELESVSIYDNYTGTKITAEPVGDKFILNIPAYFVDENRKSVNSLYLDFTPEQGGQQVVATAENTTTLTLNPLAYKNDGTLDTAKSVQLIAPGTQGKNYKEWTVRIGNGAEYWLDPVTVSAEAALYWGETSKSNPYQIIIKVDEAMGEAELNSVTIAGSTATPNSKNEVTVTVPYNTEVTNLAPVFNVSENAYVIEGGPENIGSDDKLKYIVDEGEAYNFLTPRTFTVISEDGAATETYTITVVASDEFVDVQPDDWFYDEVMTAADKGWVAGEGNGVFNPNGTLKRGDFALMIARILGYDEASYSKTAFPDVASDKYYSAAVAFCKENSIIDGDDKGNFNGEDAITREQMAKILCQALQLKVTIPEKTYDDDAKIADWAKDYVYACQEAGVMEGDNGSFRPKDNATRAEAATVLVRAFA